jgi:NAD(P)-dependent dehydrogenase (short-subunit alcohol dehydrogenase family)
MPFVVPSLQRHSISDAEGNLMTNVVIVGADRGIGAAMANVYHQRGDTVIAVCLEEGTELDDGVRVVPNIDVTDDHAVQRLAALTDQPIDVLVHVAGRGSFDRWGEFDYAQMLADYDLNALGPLRTICALEANLQPGGKVGIVTSRMGSIGDNGSGRMYGYRMSKAAANMLGVNLYHQFEPRGIRVMLLHPGTVATAMTQGAPSWDEYTKPGDAAEGLVSQMDRLGPDTPPEFRHADGTLLPW